ncbi:hypothetical protein SFC43_13740 [Bacteroides sp. CR5/BHMF/2]|nr:hypothetical protein [Bacteroides sp. CR5/BHMF/2]
MSFVDMCYLRKENIFGNMLVYRRRKTDQLLQVKIEPPLKRCCANTGTTVPLFTSHATE